jgi:type IV fimbrial biogenesis protein FimT
MIAFGRGPRALSGFTIIEMMIVVLIMATLAALAAPSMRKMILTQRVKTASFDVFSGMVLARSEAIKRNVSVTLTPTGADWVNGWAATDPNGVVLARQDPFTGIAIAGPASVTYNGAGRLSGAVVPFSLSSPDLPATGGRCIKIDLSGRPVSTTGIC